MYAPPPGGTPGPMMDMRARLRPMGIGDIVDETFRLYRENFMLFVATCAVLEVPVQIINFLIQLSAPVAVPPLRGQPLTPGQLSGLVARSGASSIAGLIGAFSGYDFTQLSSMDAKSAFKMLAFAALAGVITEACRRRTL